MKRTIFWSLLGLLSFQCFADITGEVTEYGYYQSATEMQREQNLATPTGYSRTADKVMLLENTDKIPLQKGRLFGFKFKISGFPKDQVAVQLRLVVTHPVITRPNGSVVSAYQYPVTLDVIGGTVENQSGYSLDHDYELVEGDWRFQYWLQDQMLVEQQFKTVKSVPKPTSGPGAVQAGSKDTVAPRKPESAKEPDAKKSRSEKLRTAKPQSKKLQTNKGKTKPEANKIKQEAVVKSHKTKPVKESVKTTINGQEKVKQAPESKALSKSNKSISPGKLTSPKTVSAPEMVQKPQDEDAKIGTDEPVATK